MVVSSNEIQHDMNNEKIIHLALCTNDNDAANKVYVDTMSPAGRICIWHGLIANIPTGWIICDGTNGTPDLRERFIQGAPAATEAGTTGGSASHSHDITDIEMCDVEIGAQDACVVCCLCNTTACCTTLPPYYEVIFIMKT